MILTALAVTFGLSVVLFLIVAVSAPVLKEDGTFETSGTGALRQDGSTSL